MAKGMDGDSLKGLAGKRLSTKENGFDQGSYQGIALAIPQILQNQTPL
jgi:hypothetical protein